MYRYVVANRPNKKRENVSCGGPGHSFLLLVDLAPKTEGIRLAGGFKPNRRPTLKKAYENGRVREAH